MSEVKIEVDVSRKNGQLEAEYKKDGVALKEDAHELTLGNINENSAPVEIVETDSNEVIAQKAEALVALPEGLNLSTLRIATQIREMVLQGVTIKNTLKEMTEVWLELHTKDQACLIVDMQTTKVRAQLINLYAIRLIKYLNSIVGLDLVPLAQQVNAAAIDPNERDPAARSWKLDSFLLNIGSNKINSHEHLFTLIMVNVFGVDEDFIVFSLNPSWAGLRALVLKTYDIDLGECEDVVGSPTLFKADKALSDYIKNPKGGYDAYQRDIELPVEFHW